MSIRLCRHRGLALLATVVIAVVSRSAAAWSETAAELVPVHAVTADLTAVTSDLALSGEIQARVQSNVAFRIGGKVTERRVEIGQHVEAGQGLAALDPTEQKANLDNAQAALQSAEALLQQAATNFERQQTLLKSGFATRAAFDSAQQSFKTSQAQVDAARAALSTAGEQLSYADLKATTAGIVVSRSVEVGQVVQAGQTVFVIAEDGPRDAVFNVFEAMLIRPPKSRMVDVTLQSDPSVHAVGEVREISPTIDASTGTVKIKIGLEDAPPRMTLGAAVVGKGRWERTNAIVLPWSALSEWQGRPAVWVVDAADIVSPRIVEVASYATGSVTLAGGIVPGQRVVTDGIQFLYPGQKVAVLKGEGL